MKRWLDMPLAVVLVFLATAFATSASPESCGRPVAACPDVARLLAGREGYGRGATGGLNGQFALVTSNADSGPGSLRAVLKSATVPTWVRFASDMDITLQKGISLPSDLTIDGRGHRVTIKDYGLEAVIGAHNIIATHLTIDGRFATKQVAFNIAGAHDVWVDHLDLSRFIDRLINVKHGATNVTLSWIKFHDHNKVMLFNNSTDPNMFIAWDRDSASRVTLHHCWFVDTVQRDPRATYGVYDIYNNLLENWDYYGMSFSLEARAHVNGNIFVNSANRRCAEPPYFESIENVDKSYCYGIPTAGARTALANGAADHAEYDKSMPIYHYTHDWRAFLQVGDNLYLGDARAVLADFMPGRVPQSPYCTSYRRPTEALAERIRREAGNTAAEGGAPTLCPAGVAP
jgi:pectate lyase